MLSPAGLPPCHTSLSGLPVLPVVGWELGSQDAAACRLVLPGLGALS